jgi:hypothetical protein
MLDSGCSPRAVSRLLDERISLLSAESSLATESRTGTGDHTGIGPVVGCMTGSMTRSMTESPQRHETDDVQDLGGDPVECGGIG